MCARSAIPPGSGRSRAFFVEDHTPDRLANRSHPLFLPQLIGACLDLLQTENAGFCPKAQSRAPFASAVRNLSTFQAAIFKPSRSDKRNVKAMISHPSSS